MNGSFDTRWRHITVLAQQCFSGLTLNKQPVHVITVNFVSDLHLWRGILSFALAHGQRQMKRQKSDCGSMKINEWKKLECIKG